MNEWLTWKRVAAEINFDAPDKYAPCMHLPFGIFQQNLCGFAWSIVYVPLLWINICGFTLANLNNYSFNRSRSNPFYLFCWVVILFKHCHGCYVSSIVFNVDILVLSVFRSSDLIHDLVSTPFYFLSKASIRSAQLYLWSQFRAIVL